MTPEQIETSALDLDRAEKSREQIRMLTIKYPQMNMDDAYAVQAAWVSHKLKQGRRVVGWKIGLTSKAMQQALNINIPDSGVLLDDMEFFDGGTIPKLRFIQPRIEAEIAFVMAKDLAGPYVTAADVLAATDYVAPMMEILDTRILRVDTETKKTRTVFDTIADNAANAGFVIGKQRHLPSNLDLRWVGAIVSRNGEVEETGLGAGVLNDPALSTAWLANRLALYGQSIKAGDIVLSGSFVRPVEAPSGAFLEADFGSFGKVSCHFS
jgi:2-oxo-hept-3-ene-1,7-dioate hydratase